MPLDPDRERAWDVLDDDGRARVRALAAEVGAQVGLVAALGEPRPLRRRPQPTTSMVFSSRWRHLPPGVAGLLQGCPRPWAKSRVLCRSFMVNTDHLAMALGRRPTRGEVVSEFLGRRRPAASSPHEAGGGDDPIDPARVASWFDDAAEPVAYLYLSPWCPTAPRSSLDEPAHHLWLAARAGRSMDEVVERVAQEAQVPLTTSPRTSGTSAPPGAQGPLEDTP